MTAHALAMLARRGACPGLSAPMPTGDGLLVRLLPIGTVPLAAFTKLCAAAQVHGNGIVEITSRGSIQVRGLSAASAMQFAADMAALKIAAQDGVPVLTNPLAGLDAEEVFDAAALAADLRRALARRSMAAKLGAKVSVAVDGGGAIGLDAIAADIRLDADRADGGDVLLRVSAGGDGTRATALGHVTPAHGVEAAVRLLDVVGRRGRDARARDLLAADGATVFRPAIAALLEGEVPERLTRGPGDAIGLHRLHDGSLASGIGLAFGHADAMTLQRLTDAAALAGARGVRAAPGRTLLIIGLAPRTASAFAASAAQLGFIVHPDDPRRHVVACAGAPICRSAHIAARAMAPRIVEIAAPRLDGSHTIHISGCAKGCAHAAPAELTIVGTAEGCALVANGGARDTPFATVAAHDLPAAIAQYTGERRHEADHV